MIPAIVITALFLTVQTGAEPPEKAVYASSVTPINAVNETEKKDSVVLETDITAFVNGYLIESWNINGYTGVAVEDLENYGFDVRKNDTAKTYTITLPENEKEINAAYEVSPTRAPFGKFLMYCEPSEYLVFAGGRTPVQAYHVNGNTVVLLRDLGYLGVTEWNAEDRTSAFRIVEMWKPETEPWETVPVSEDIPFFSLLFTKQEDGTFVLSGKNPEYFADHNIELEMGVKSKVIFRFFQNDTGFGMVQDAMREIVTVDLRSPLSEPIQNTLAARRRTKIVVNDYMETILEVGETEGNGHVDYHFVIDGLHEKEKVETIQISFKAD